MNNKKTLYIVLGLLVICAAVFFFSRKSEPSEQENPVGSISNLEAGTPPWPAEFAHLKDRLAAIGLPALSAEGTALHIHQHLDIDINGQVVAVPADIGIDPNGQFISPIHVHDTSGVIHVESPTVQTFTLGQFFDIWGLTFTNECIGGECTNGANTLRVYVNGTLYQGDPRTIALAAHQEIFVFYGTTAQLPKIIPASFDFPAGL